MIPGGLNHCLLAADSGPPLAGSGTVTLAAGDFYGNPLCIYSNGLILQAQGSITGNIKGVAIVYLQGFVAAGGVFVVCLAGASRAKNFFESFILNGNVALTASATVSNNGDNTEYQMIMNPIVPAAGTYNWSAT